MVQWDFLYVFCQRCNVKNGLRYARITVCVLLNQTLVLLQSLVLRIRLCH